MSGLRERKALIVSLCIAALLHLAALIVVDEILQRRQIHQTRLRVELMVLQRRLEVERARGKQPRIPLLSMTRWGDEEEDVPSGRPDLLERYSAQGDVRMDSLLSEAEVAALGNRYASQMAQEVKSVDIPLPQYQGLTPGEVGDYIRLPAGLDLELLRTKDLDTGRYRAVVLVDPDEKRELSGYVDITPVMFQGAQFYPMALANLVEYLNQHTHLHASIQGKPMELSSPDLFKAPLIYMTGKDNPEMPLSFTDVELENLTRYLERGGFAFIEDIGQRIPGTSFDQQMRYYLRKALGAKAKFFRLPKDHPLYHSYYDFLDGPPLGGETWDYERNVPLKRGPVDYLEGIEINGRLAVLFSDINVSWYWGSPYATGRERGLQFGVNIVAYALTQPGNLAHKIGRPARPVRSHEADESCYLAVYRGKSSEPIDLKKVTIHLDGEEIRGVFGEGEYVGFLLGGLRGGAKTVRIEYQGKVAEVQVVLKQDRVAAVVFGMDRIAFVRRLWARLDGEYVSYGDWKARYAQVDIREITAPEGTGGGS